MEKEQRTKRDAMLAMKIHRHKLAKVHKYFEESLQGMTSTPTGNALIFVQHVLSLHCQLEASAPNNLDITSKVDIKEKDGMAPLTELLLQMRELFKDSGIYATVDIGFNYKNHHFPLELMSYPANSPRNICAPWPTCADGFSWQA